jgi:hypothetical protein
VRILVHLTLACDACGAEHGDRDEFLCRRCRGMSKARRLGHAPRLRAGVFDCARCGRAGVVADGASGPLFTTSCEAVS